MSETYQGEDCEIDPGATVGYEYAENISPAELGDRVVVRTGSIVYGDVKIDDETQTGHNVLIREHTEIGQKCIVGTNTVIDGYSEVGDNVSLQTGVYVPAQTTIEDRAFVGPCAVLTNDPYPVRQDVDLEGPTLKQSVSIGANATVLPGVTIGERAFVAAGAVVTEDVPAETLAVGAPATFKSLPQQLQEENGL
ncbi:DapH/DapD/GlmU-related protein [Halobellus sp. GM3]|uniref:DapH/DapD/GlmU-related protein n=1 Tax=Halobellus sp. GM3 TaxID=3458410 RepID=UPI00403DDF60